MTQQEVCLKAKSIIAEYGAAANDFAHLTALDFAIAGSARQAEEWHLVAIEVATSWRVSSRAMRLLRPLR